MGLNFRYQDKGTLIHNLNPFVKLAWVSSTVLLAMIFEHPLYLLLLFLVTLPVVIAAKGWPEWLSLLRFVFYLSLVIIIINSLVMYHGTHVLLEFTFEIPTLGQPKITLEAICFGLGMSLRLLAIVSAFTILNLTVHPDDMLLAALKLRLPYKSVLATSLSTRFMPALIDDLGRLTDVQRSRGLEIDKGKLGQKIRSRGAVLIPLLSNSLDRTVQIAEAMESRAFGAGKTRTYYKEIKLTPLGLVQVAASFLPFIFGLFLRFKGFGGYRYYPSLQKINLNWSELTPMLILVILLLAILPLAWGSKGELKNWRGG